MNAARMVLATDASANRRGELRHGASLADFTSWHVGGLAEALYLPADREDLADFLARLPPHEPVLWIGLGSNLLVRDGGVAGTVICTKNRLKGLTLDGLYVDIEAGVPCARIARVCAEADLRGAEFFAGIPGTFGGALAMNAGAFGDETWPLVVELQTLDRHGLVRRRLPLDYQVGYRSVIGPADEWFVGARLRLERGDAESSRARIRELLARRSATQPTNQPSCGSVFRNPPNDHAARLIEQCGLKGLRLGGAQVSEKHANFIVNTGNATAADIESLIFHVRQYVFEQRGIRLETEVRIVGVQ